MNYNRESVRKKLRSQSAVMPRVRRKLAVTVCMILCFVLVMASTIGGSLAFGSFKALVDNATDISFDDVAPDNYYTLLYDASGNVMDKLVMAGSIPA